MGKRRTKLLSLLLTLTQNQRRLQRVMLGYATECEMDALGRILLSGPLRQHAKIRKGLMLVGQLNNLKFGAILNGTHKLDEDIEIGSSSEFGASEELKTLSL